MPSAPVVFLGVFILLFGGPIFVYIYNLRIVRWLEPPEVRPVNGVGIRRLPAPRRRVRRESDDEEHANERENEDAHDD